MNLSRREFMQLLAAASASGFHFSVSAKSTSPASNTPSNPYEIPPLGQVSLLHYTDCHAQLLPLYFREPHINLGVASMKDNPPHRVGQALLQHYGIKPNSREAYALTHLNFTEAARQYGKVGGFAHLATLVKQVRAQRPGALLLDGGDTWQGSATALWTQAQDMVDAQRLLGVDIMTGHWEFTFGAERVKQIVNQDFAGKIEFVAQNIVESEWEERVFKPFVLREINQVPVAIIGQAFPYTPIANPRYQVPNWSFGIRDEAMQRVVNEARSQGAQVVVVLSHNGMDVDLKMASRVTGIDAILGGHTHDAVPRPVEVSNAAGKTLVINSGSNGKFLSVLDLAVKAGKITGYQYKLLPVFANLLSPDPTMAAYIQKVRAPYQQRLAEPLAITDDLLYRRGNFNGTFDQLICDALMEVQGAQIAFSPGFRWGGSVLPGSPITLEDVMTQTAITYPTVTVNNLSGATIKSTLEDVADNLFNEDPYYQQGGDMVRVGGLQYSIDPTASIGQRISDLELNGQPLDANKEYSVAGWASVAQPLAGTPIWEVVSEYLRSKKTVRISTVNSPKIKGITHNAGLAS